MTRQIEIHQPNFVFERRYLPKRRKVKISQPDFILVELADDFEDIFQVAKKLMLKALLLVFLEPISNFVKILARTVLVKNEKTTFIVLVHL
jgi:hypothetical protein